MRLCDEADVQGKVNNPILKGYTIFDGKFGQCCCSSGLRAEEQTDVTSRPLSVLFFKD